MKVTMVIPSYWARESKVGWKEGDAIYDHPTPLDSEGTLSRAIQSIDILRDKDFQLVIIAVPTVEDIETQVEKKVASIIKSNSATTGVETLLFGSFHLKQIHELLIDEGKKEYNDLLQLRGYSSIRNLCMFIPHILDSEVAVFIDDDEVFEDPEFVSKAKEFIGKDIGGRIVNAVAGYYIQPDGDYHVKKPFHPWMKYWDQYDRMNEAFDKFIGTEPRLKETPFVFGGNMVIHRDLFIVPFDPWVPRGEDIDFLINAKIFGFTFFLDNQLSIRHLPPSKTHSTWMQLREDIYRFIYERAKIEHQKEIKGMTKVYPEDFGPYPGCFLKEDLEEKIEKSCKLLSEEYLAHGDRKDSEEALDNIYLAKTDAVPKSDHFKNLCNLQKRWQELMEYTGKTEVRSSIKEIIKGERE
jgi:glycosyltransferase involved in cell wall biosynthesis